VSDAALRQDIKQFIKVLERHEYGRSNREKFRDFCEMAYCSYAQSMALSEEQADTLEEQYMRVVNRYRDKDAVRAYPEAIGIASKYIGHPHYMDFLGIAAGEVGTLSGEMGQFFTPTGVSRMMAEMIMTQEDVQQRIEENGYIKLGESAVGGGGMVLSAARSLAENGFNPATQMFVGARDVSASAFHIAYVQLTLAAIPACIAHGNSLSMETFSWSWTPAVAVFCNHHDIPPPLRGDGWVNSLTPMAPGVPEKREPPPEPKKPTQPELF